MAARTTAQPRRFGAEIDDLNQPVIRGGSVVTVRQSIVFNGDLGSGKSTVSVEIAKRLGLRRVSVGDLYREMAQERQMTALQLNLHAELDQAVDGYVDQLQRDIAASGEQLVMDCRLAWHFFTDALKVHMITEPGEAARRVLARPSGPAESYTSLEEAKAKLRERSESERDRFLVRYGVDKARLRNYDLICDTTRASADEVIEHIIDAYEGRLGRRCCATRRRCCCSTRAGSTRPRRSPALRGLWDWTTVAEVAAGRRAGAGAAGASATPASTSSWSTAPSAQRRPAQRRSAGAGPAGRRGRRAGGRWGERDGLLRRPGPAQPDPRLGGRPRHPAAVAGARPARAATRCWPGRAADPRRRAGGGERLTGQAAPVGVSG